MIDAIAYQRAKERFLNLLLEDPSNARRVLEKLDQLPPSKLARFSPTHLAQALGIETDRLNPLLLVGVKAGLLEMTWDNHCSYCGSLVHGQGSLNLLDTGFYCTLCEGDMTAHLDDQVEINFRLARELGEPDFDPFKDAPSYEAYCFSEHLRRSEPVAQFIENQAKRGFVGLDPGETGHLTAFAQVGERFRVISLENDARVYLNIVEGGPLGPVELRLTAAGFEPIGVEVGPGPLEVNLRNELGHRAGALLLYTDQAHLFGLIQAGPPQFTPFVSGKDMLNHQPFRELFPVQNLPVDLSLNLRDLTILFTDLKGSTELYGSTGDRQAYQLVHTHFDLLTQAVRQHRGALVKTMGDAIMASFSKASDALDAAFTMLRSIEEFNEGLGAGRLGLKVGLHSGAAIAVNANQSLDFFGQTINIAARVQGLAQAGEIRFTRPVMDQPEVLSRLQSLGPLPEPQEAKLKGVSGWHEVYCITPLAAKV
ncbi:MAG: adenylate/guanylate cyclase domain-containing protein [bacterium]|nr:adenylate/guanylate cyclase domain-containing protein [bacterium]